MAASSRPATGGDPARACSTARSSPSCCRRSASSTRAISAPARPSSPDRAQLGRDRRPSHLVGQGAALSNPARDRRLMLLDLEGGYLAERADPAPRLGHADRNGDHGAASVDRRHRDRPRDLPAPAALNGLTRRQGRAPTDLGAHHQIGDRVEFRRLAIDDDQRRALALGDDREGRGRKDHQRRADDEEQVRLQGQRMRLAHLVLRHRLAERDRRGFHRPARTSRSSAARRSPRRRGGSRRVRGASRRRGRSHRCRCHAARPPAPPGSPRPGAARRCSA